MKSFLSLLACVSLTAFAVAKGDSYPASEKSSQTYSLAADGTVRLANVNGSVEITAWDRNEVLVETEKRARNKEDLSRIRVEVEAQPDRIAITTVHEKTGSLFSSDIRGEVRYRVKVPAGAKLEKISSVNSTLAVNGVRGPVTLQTVNGTVRATGLAHDTRIETVNGSITARFAEVRADQHVEIESVNGTCEVFLPRDVGVRLNLASVNGSTSCDFPITLEKSSRRTLRGTIGSGAVALKASTVNGSIRVKRI